MKPKARNGRWPAIAGVAAILLVSVSGCLEKHLVWSPDGARAAVVARDGLHLCDPTGALTPLLLPDVYQVAWLGDSQRVVVARTRAAADWATIAGVLGAERAGQVAAEAEAAWRKLEAGGPWSVVTMNLGERKGPNLRKIYLRDRRGEALRAQISASEWSELQSLHADVSELAVARIEDGQVQPGPALYRGLEKIEDLRVAPGDQTVMFTTEQSPDNDDECRLLVAPLDAPGAVSVAEHTATYPDWTPDGRAVVYVQAAGGAKDDLRLGTLARREVVGADGKIAIAAKPDELAGMLFGKMVRVRCLRDGRILFNAAEFSLPVSAKDAEVGRETLFAWDGARQATLVRMIPRGEADNLPKGLTFFEVSPDDRRVLVGGVDGEVSVLTLATGEVQEWQKAGDYNLMGAPVWRNAEEIAYARRNPLVDGRRPDRWAEIVRRRATPGPGDGEVVLSRDWSKEMLESVYGPSDRK